MAKRKSTKAKAARSGHNGGTGKKVKIQTAYGRLTVQSKPVTVTKTEIRKVAELRLNTEDIKRMLYAALTDEYGDLKMPLMEDITFTFLSDEENTTEEIRLTW